MSLVRKIYILMSLCIQDRGDIRADLTHNRRVCDSDLAAPSAFGKSRESLIIPTEYAHLVTKVMDPDHVTVVYNNSIRQPFEKPHRCEI